MSREPRREPEAASVLSFFTVFCRALQEAVEKDSKLLATVDEQDEDDDDISLPASETTVGDLAGSEDVVRPAESIESTVDDEEGAGRFFVLSLFSFVSSEGLLLPSIVLTDVRLELLPAAAAALATNSSWYMVCRLMFLST